MARILPLLLCLLMTPVLAGCSDRPEAPPSDPAGADGEEPLGTASRPAGAAAAGPSTEPRTAVCSGTVFAAAGVQGNLQMGVYCAFKEAAPGDLSRHEAAIVEIRWPDAVPTQTRFNVFLLSDGCNFSSPGGTCILDSDASPEPSFRYEVPTGLLRSDGDDGLRVYASFDGPAVQQTVDVAVTLVPAGGVLPAGHSALPA